MREPHEFRPSDDVVLFHGPGMARELRRFADLSDGRLPPAVVLAHRLDWDDVRLALDSGAASYLLENRYAYLLTEALLCTSRGASILDPAIAAEQVRVAARARAEERERARTSRPEPAAAPGRLCRLSRREQQVMELLVAGQGVRDVAQVMSLTDKTVRNYLSRIYTKLNVGCRSEAILYWLGHLDSRDSDVRADGAQADRVVRST
ncbi:response regulator transcription factor [Streptomyces sp. NBC_01485]|uniref:helix-turn-helix transcriptional regulator n=1 Tax=Streptomyces sp. NBC_01485 TaxID=2903884 RepID=UPI002E34B6A1|nr:response regulator transcription factor [Streptomyces sp. NBC_01485]